MTFPTGWGRKCPLVIQASGINSDLTDFPVLLTEDILPLEIFDADGNYTALSGGGDIRFSSNYDGGTQLACEVVTFITDNDPANGKAEIWVKVPSISSSVNTVIYIWYKKVDETQPVSNGTYGSESVWDSHFKIVQHMNEDPSGSAPQMIDSTSNSNDGTSGGAMTSGDLVITQIGDGLDFDGDNDFINCNFTTNYASVFTLEAWIKKDVNVPSSEVYEIISKRSYYATDTSDFPFALVVNENQKINFGLSKGNDYTFDLSLSSSSTIDNNSFYHVVAVYKSANYGKLYINGIEEASGTIDFTISTNSRSWFVGESSYPYGDGANKNQFTGKEDEVRISNIARSADWIKAEYNNQNNPSVFVIVKLPIICYFSGYVFEQNNPVSRKLYLYDRATGELMNTTTSSDNGYYYMETISSGSHCIVCLDDDAGIEYNDLIIGPAFPIVEYV